MLGSSWAPNKLYQLDTYETINVINDTCLTMYDILEQDTLWVSATSLDDVAGDNCRKTVGTLWQEHFHH